MANEFAAHWDGPNPPNYTEVFAWRQRQLKALRADPNMRLGAIEFYRTHPAEFIEHWCDTYDPRLASTESPSHMPFVLFQRQKELIDFIYTGVHAQTDLLVEKARDMGATWLACAVSAHLWRFLPGASIGWGSRKEQLVDKLGDADSIFEKIRMLIRGWPKEFQPKGFSPSEHMPFMRILNPESGATITGESGDNIGRGGRKLIYFKDESAHYERPEKIEAALSDNTRVQIDISSVNGLGNVFHRRRESGHDWSPGEPMERGKTYVFVMDWRDHPQKTDAWYQQRKAKFTDEGLAHIFAQEVDRNYAASITGVIINADHIRAAIDAHLPRKREGLPDWEGFDDEGRTFGGQDIADEGGDKNALAIRKGPILKFIDHWGDGDTGVTARRCVSECAKFGPMSLQYDSVGVGAGFKAETNRLKLESQLPNPKIKWPTGLHIVPWNAGAKALFPESRMIRGDPKSMINKDYFSGLKAQGWWQLARRFERTYRAVVEGREYDPGELISIPSSLGTAIVRRLEKELAQVTQSLSTVTMKMIVEKAPEGTQSPNLADAVMMAYWPINTGAAMYSKDAIG